MELYTASLTLRTVDASDIKEVARMWDWQNGQISDEKAKEAVLWMQDNHKKNKQGYIYHLCLAVYEDVYKRQFPCHGELCQQKGESVFRYVCAGGHAPDL